MKMTTPEPKFFQSDKLNPDKNLVGINQNLDHLIGQIKERNNLGLVDVGKYLNRMLESSTYLQENKVQISQEGFNKITETLKVLGELIHKNAPQSQNISEDIETIKTNLEKCLPEQHEVKQSPRPS